jgi:hypothetical protein
VDFDFMLDKLLQALKTNRGLGEMHAGAVNGGVNVMAADTENLPGNRAIVETPFSLLRSVQQFLLFWGMLWCIFYLGAVHGETIDGPTHWSLVPIRDVSLFKVDDHEWNEHPIDRLVYRQLDQRHLQPSPEADARTLIRRLSFDLTGLPPSLEEVDLFLDDASGGVYERLVDRLLESPHYGEHMARYWLDLVRYADTHGLHADDYREMFKYRDWLIDAFNRNQSFDSFILEQVAGDLLPDPSNDQLVASGFNRLHLSNSAGSALEEELYYNNVVDRVNAVGTVFLGLTLGCAQCHDHKSDPITMREYYQIFAFFNNLDGLSHTQRKKSPPPFLSFPSNEQSVLMSELKAKLDANSADKDEVDKLKKELASLERAIPTTMIMRERSEMRPAHIYRRGLYDQAGVEVQRCTPQALPPMKPDHPLNRLGFCQWLIDRDHPLTARVAVNRFWQQLFGVGLVKTSEDFGVLGSAPSHPELLDHLAHRFVESGWDVKALLKYIVTSRTYRQTSNASEEAYRQDPENRWLSRGSRFRLDAEMLRDQALAVSGLLDRTLFGRSVKPPQPDGLWKSVALAVSNTRVYEPDQGADIYRRSIYTFWKRSIPHPVMTIFDAPTREVCTARRERTNTPLQALVLMNEPQFVECAVTLAKRTLIEGGTTDMDRMRYVWEITTSRTIDADEMEMMLNGLRFFRDAYAERSSIPFGDTELNQEEAAWTMVVHTLLNLDIVKTRP